MTDRRLSAGLLVLSSTLLLGAQFRGCSGGETPPEAVLPESTGGCLVDADCVSAAMCIELRCVAGECVDSGFMPDGDGDRFSPIPCGDDCDDGDASVYPGASELCDGLDQDCDGRIDEGAPGIRTTFVGGRAAEPGVLIGLAERYALVAASGSPRSLTVSLIDTDGRDLDTQVLGEIDERAPFAAARDAAQVTVVAGGTGTMRAWVLTETASGFEVGAPADIAPDVGVIAIDVGLFGGQRWVVFETIDGARVLVNETGARVDLAPGESAPRLASDGRNVAVTDGDDTIRFFTMDGAEVGRQTLPGPLAYRGLASGDGVVVACYRDAFDHALTRVSPDATTSPVTAPFGDSADRVSVFGLRERVVVTRVSDVTAGAWLLDPSLGTYLATFPLEELSPDLEVPLELFAAENDDALGAILMPRGPAPASLALLECR